MCDLLIKRLPKKEKKNMKKAEFAEQLGAVIGTKTKKEAIAAVDAFVALIAKTVKHGDEVVIPELGKFLLKKRPAHEARNPMTGAIVKVPAKVVPAFRASKKFKTEVLS